MNFLNLAAFGLLALVPVIIFFYLLKLRRRPHVVPSILFWRRAVEDLTANAPFQKLRRNLLLYLQLLILLLIVFALSRPVMNLRVREGRSILLLMDVSASMQTREGSKTRFDMAVEQTQQLIDDMQRGDSMMIITFARTPRVVASFTNDRARLHQLVRSIEATHEATNLREAFLLATSLARGRNAPEILIVSDGALPGEGLGAEAESGVAIRFHKIGLAAENVGFTRVDLRRAPESERQFQLFTAVTNYSRLPKNLVLEVRNNGVLIDARNVRVDAESTSGELIENTLLEEGEIVLSLGGMEEDPFPVDDVAFLTLRKPSRTRILLVGPGNFFLEKAIRFDRDLNAELSTLPIEAYPPDNLDEYDVTVFDTVSPEILPPGNYMFIGALPPLPGFEETGRLAAPPIFDWDSQHPVVRFVELSDVAVAAALDVELPPASITLASTEAEKPLIAYYSAQNRNIVLLTFDLYDSNLPLRMAFPLLISNTLNFLSRGKAASQTALYKTGQTVELFAPAEAEEITVEDPQGESYELQAGSLRTAAFDHTSRIGFYKVDYGEAGEAAFGVNLLDEQESNIAPKQMIDINERTTVLESELNRTNTEIWHWFALAGLLFLVAEWYAFHRRIGV